MKYRTDLWNKLFKTTCQSVLAVPVLMAISTIMISPVEAQLNNTQEEELPVPQWLEFKKAQYGERPILVHLKNGSERAILMPEPIRIMDGQSLPGTAIEINTDVIGFFPTRSFTRKSVRFIGLDTGTVYELQIRASPQGLLQPLQITR